MFRKIKNVLVVLTVTLLCMQCAYPTLVFAVTDPVEISISDIGNIDSIEEWKEYVQVHGLIRDTSHDDEDVVSFCITIDPVNSTFDVDTVFVTGSRSKVTSGSAVHERYSNNGSLLFTLTVNGTFTRTSGSSCTCTSASGSFDHPITSFWRSTPSYSRGNLSATKAYAKMYGTATKIIGTGSISYTFFLYCNAEGALTSEYSES